jgi:hypothetical protein
VYTCTPLRLLPHEDVGKLTPTCAPLVLKYIGVLSSSLSSSTEQDVSLQGGNANTILCAIASFAPAKLLMGASNIQTAQTYGWTSFIWSSIEVPLQALSMIRSNGNSSPVTDKDNNNNNDDEVVVGLT